MGRKETQKQENQRHSTVEKRQMIELLFLVALAIVAKELIQAILTQDDDDIKYNGSN